MCRVGSNYERKRLNGMSHFLEHMCFKGTNTRTKSDIIDYFAKIGASYNAATSDDYTSYYALAHKRHWEKLLDIIIDIYMNGSFPEKEPRCQQNWRSVLCIMIVLSDVWASQASDPQQKHTNCREHHCLICAVKISLELPRRQYTSS